VYAHTVPRLLGIRIQNFKSLADVTVGRLRSGRDGELDAVTCFIGKNGCGKSSLLDVFAFIADCLREGVEAACDKEHRGGFDRLCTQGKAGPISFELYFRLSADDRPMKYEFGVDAPAGIPRVAHERLFLSSEGAQIGTLGKFLDVKAGKGSIWLIKGNTISKVGKAQVALADLDKLAIATYGQLPEHPLIGAFRKYLESWYLSYFVPGDARRLAPSGVQRRLDRTGANVGNVLQYLERQHGERVKLILEEIADAIPGVTKIRTADSPDRRLLIEFSEAGYTDPFFQASMSDGTLKFFTYLLLLHDPDPPPFVGIEEPENGLYHKLHGVLAARLAELSARSAERTQILVTTHSPYFVDALKPEQVWQMRKGGGATTARRTADMPHVRALIEEGVPLGSLWYSNELDED
jgi:predicted ATPase